MTNTVMINIQGNSYEMKCSSEQEEKLLEAAKIVDDTMTQAKGQNISNEKAAILTSLNLASQLLEKQLEIENLTGSYNPTATEQINNIINNIHKEIETHMTK